MSFVYPGLLYGLLLGSIPIIVYYLMRFRSLRVPWGADYILERALARRRKKVYLDQIILLALRALVVMALVTAFARPQSRKKAIAGGDQVLRILLVDGTYSMLAGEGGHTRRDTAMEAVRELVTRWGRGQKWSLYALDSRPRWVVDRAEVINAQDSLAILDTLDVEESNASLAAGLEAVLAHGAGQRREIYIFADDQATSWDGADRAVAAMDDKTSVFWVHPPLADRRNLAVTKLELGHERALRGFFFPAYAEVRNFGGDAVRDAELTFLADGAVIGSKRVSLPPGQNVSVPMDIRIDGVGPHLITARLNDDVLPFDNAMSAGIEISESISMLVLRDAKRAGKFESSAGWLALVARVLAGKTTDESRGPLLVTEYTGPECEVSMLAEYDAVVLDGGRTLTPELADALRRYVDLGGGLVLAADNNVDLAEWRKQLGRVNLLPAVPVRRHNEPIGGERCRRLSRSGFDMPALRGLENDPDGDITRVRFFTWVEFDAPAPGAEVLARFSDGSPYAWRRRFERGSVLLLAAGLNSHNNNLLVRETVYPFLVHLFSETAAAAQYTRSVGRNEAVRYLAKCDPPPVAAQFGLERDEPVLAALTPVEQGMLVEYAAGSDRSGAASLLVLREGGGDRIWVGVQGERSDSDLTSMPALLRGQMADLLGWTEVASAGELIEQLESAGHGKERYSWVVLAVLLFGIGELLMGLRFI